MSLPYVYTPQIWLPIITVLSVSRIPLSLVIVSRPQKTITFFITSLIVAAPGFCYAVFMDKNQPSVILYGDSLILEGVRAELAGDPSLKVILLADPLAKPWEELRALHPALIIFDLGVTQPDFPLALLQRPDLLLIGLDPATRQALVWSGRQFSALSIQELFALIQKGRQEEARGT